MSLGRFASPLVAVVVTTLVGCMPAKRASDRSNAAIDDLEEARFSTNEPRAQLMLSEAMDWVGVPYRFGGTTRDGIDCSAFVRTAAASAEVALPRRSIEQAASGHPVEEKEIAPGDLLFFNTNGRGVSHVGMAIDSRRFVHASSSRGVTVSSLDEDYYRSRFLFARRIL